MNAIENLRIELKAKNIALDSLLNGVIIADRQWEILFVNQTYRNLCLYDIDTELVGRSLDDVLAMDIFYPALKEQLKLTGHCGDRFQKLRVDGSSFPAQLTATLVPAGNEDTNNIVISITDITNLVKAEFAEYQAYSMLEKLANSIKTGLWAVDRHYNIARTNNRQLQILGKTSEEVIGKKCYDVWNEPICKSENCPMKELGKGLLSIEHESQMTSKNGQVKNYTMRGIPFVAHDLSYVICETFDDITELRNLEKKFMNYVDNERMRIGQELHDGLSQKIAGIALLAESVKQNIVKKNLPSITDINHILNHLGEAIDQTRSISSGLFTNKYGPDTLKDGLEELAENVQELYGIQCILQLKGNINITDEHISTNIYHIAREAVHNAVKHSDCDRIEIIIDQEQAGLTMIIHNNGKPKNKDKSSKGIGLKIMHYRARSMGGEFSYKTDDGGFTVQVHLFIK